MSYQEKQTIISIVLGVFILAAYFIYAFLKHQAGDIASNDIKSWAIIMLIFIGILIIASIIIQVIFHILLSIGVAVKEKIKNEQCNENDIKKSISAEIITDEMDKLIGLKSIIVAFIITGVGFICALFTQVLNYSPVVMLNTMFLSFGAGYIFEGLTKIYYYRKGINNVSKD